MVHRLTRPTALVLEFLLECRRNGAGETWGFEISRSTGLKGGTVYPLLNKLLGDGWVDSRWEDTDEAGPRRRMYRLTSAGAAEAATLLARPRRGAAGEVAWTPT